MDYAVAEVIVQTQEQAEDVIAGLKALIKGYKKARVSDLYDLVSLRPSYADEQHGWTDLSAASVKSVQEGYLLELPKVEPLN